MHQTALKVPFQVGTYITVFVISEPETIDNFDDEDWNYVPTSY